METPTASPPPPEHASSGYSSRFVSIKVGQEREPFNIHEDKLCKTAFFTKHGKPKETIKVSAVGVNSGGSASDPWVIDIDGDDDDADAYPTYNLPGDSAEDFRAFKIFADWLYSEPPGHFKNRQDIQVARKAYLLALTYEAYSLQNALVDRFREYYLKEKINFEDLTFLIDRVERTKAGWMTSTTLTVYMIMQVAYEICTDGYDSFKEQNPSFEDFINRGNCKHRSDIVRAISNFARDSKREDPAKGSHNWHVETEGEVARPVKMEVIW